ncbi:MAG: type II toxin-antitoxin system prevent-host-death family antitoxin [Candidatus Methylophosphatis roskildensis]
MQVNILEAKNQLSRLVKAAAAGEEVIIASNGTPMVRLVPVAASAGLAGWGKLKLRAADVDAAFAPELDAEIAESLHDA